MISLSIKVAVNDFVHLFNCICPAICFQLLGTCLYTFTSFWLQVSRCLTFQWKVIVEKNLFKLNQAPHCCCPVVLPYHTLWSKYLDLKVKCLSPTIILIDAAYKCCSW